MARKKRLKWGETPWDGMPRDELLRTVQQMYASHQEMLSCLRVQKSSDEARYPGQLRYWGANGVGGAAIEMGSQVEAAVTARCDAETLYDVFFRYARDLLFDTSRHRMIGFGWMACTNCTTMLGRVEGFPQPTSCARTGCPGTLRPLTWDDLKPEAAHA